MAPMNFTDQPVTDDLTIKDSDDDDGLNKFQIHILILFILASLCLVLGIINIIIHRYGQRRRVPFQTKHQNLDTVSGTVQNGALNGPAQVKFNKGKRAKSVKMKGRTTSVKSKTKIRI